MQNYSRSAISACYCGAEPLYAGDAFLDQALHGEPRLVATQPADLEYLKAIEATLSEWQGPADDSNSHFGNYQVD